MFSNMSIPRSTGTYWEQIERLKSTIKAADAIVIGAGAGLSTSAGFVYTGERFKKYFSDFEEKYGFHDMYSGGFYPYKAPEKRWAYWSRYIFINRYMDAPKPVYDDLLALIRDKNYFVITTNVDHCFQKAGFSKERLFYTQGDYGLFQCSKPCDIDTYDNEKTVREMVLEQRFLIGEKGELLLPEGKALKMSVSTGLLPICPKCGAPLTMNLRADDTFVEDEGWLKAAGRYQAFLERIKNRKTLFLELGVGYNTPVIIKYPFWQMTAESPAAVYACINYGEAVCPSEIEKQSICINSDIGEALKDLR